MPPAAVFLSCGLCVPTNTQLTLSEGDLEANLASDLAERRDTNLVKKAALFRKEISSANSISLGHKLSVKWMLRRGIPSDSLGCSIKGVRDALSGLDFTI